MEIRKNPYSFKGPVGGTKFIGRKDIIVSIARVLLGRESVAIIGQPDIGKTSTLLLLSREEVLNKLIGNSYPNIKISFIDAHILRGISNPSDFWEYALRPFEENNTSLNPELQSAYEKAKSISYNATHLDIMFKEFYKNNCAYVLVIDEFDDFLSNAALNSGEFFANLRSLVSLNDSFKLIIASTLTINELQSYAYKNNDQGSSPFFNTLRSYTLTNFNQMEMDALFNLSDLPFSPRDRIYVTKVSGNHPHLAQLSCAMLIESYNIQSGVFDYSQATKAIYLQSRQHFADMWRRMGNGNKIALTLVAMHQIPRLLSRQNKTNDWLNRYVSEYSANLYELEDQGYVTKMGSEAWKISQYALIWWIGDIIKKGTRKEKEFQRMLQQLFLELPKRERANFLEATQTISTIIGKSSLSLIEAFSKGFAEGIGNKFGQI